MIMSRSCQAAKTVFPIARESAPGEAKKPVHALGQFLPSALHLTTRFTSRTAIRRSVQFGLLLWLATLFAMPFPALAMPACDDTDGELSMSLFEQHFDSGARWSMCWAVHPLAGLSLSQVHYGAPNEPLRQVLASASLGQILLKYDEETEYQHLLTDRGMGGSNRLDSANVDCNDGQWLTSTHLNSQSDQICVKFRDLNVMTQIRSETPLRRRQVSMHDWSRIDNFIYQVIWQFSEDGEIIPAVDLSGRIGVFTDDERYGSPVGVGQERQLASHATFLMNWRLHFAIGGSEADDQPDVVDEIQFTSETTDAVRLSLDIRRLETETLRKVDREKFRGWRVSDRLNSASLDGVTTTRVGYFLDPQTAGYSYLGRKYNWSLFDLAITAWHPCEQFASNNIGPGSCDPTLDHYTNGEALQDADPVLWYSLTRHLVPSNEDYPAIAAMRTEFRLIPFDWSPYTPFNPPVEEP